MNQVLRSAHADRCERLVRSGGSQLALPCSGRTIYITELPGVALGSSIWDCGQYFVRYLDSPAALVHFSPDFFVGKRVVELGSGTGLVGIAFALKGAEVVVTDKQEVLELMQTNVATNCPPPCEISARVLDWGDKAAALSLNPPFEFVVGADVVYNRDSFFLLLDSMLALGDSATTYLLAYRRRGLDEVEFFQRVSELFVVQELNRSESQNVTLFRLNLKS
eukprot:gnl/Spiro4/22079_TR10865_c1_g1_i1.p1 gnl/Spiro4/22079_TR10865_c1_g1~~gnl/Spiro4/22079_TR10865_c1_g1_i1.p1  ORF type:complete len:241 (-),score=74.52 gnl/Spiro4/22079_TR10865_c1_g1_i1:48-710(-)